jgi:hypothetical protein
MMVALASSTPITAAVPLVLLLLELGSLQLGVPAHGTDGAAVTAAGGSAGPRLRSSPAPKLELVGNRTEEEPSSVAGTLASDSVAWPAWCFQSAARSCSWVGKSEGPAKSGLKSGRGGVPDVPAKDAPFGRLDAPTMLSYAKTQEADVSLQAKSELGGVPAIRAGLGGGVQAESGRGEELGDDVLFDQSEAKTKNTVRGELVQRSEQKILKQGGALADGALLGQQSETETKTIGISLGVAEASGTLN